MWNHTGGPFVNVAEPTRPMASGQVPSTSSRMEQHQVESPSPTLRPLTDDQQYSQDGTTRHCQQQSIESPSNSSNFLPRLAILPMSLLIHGLCSLVAFLLGTNNQTDCGAFSLHNCNTTLQYSTAHCKWHPQPPQTDGNKSHHNSVILVLRVV